MKMQDMLFAGFGGQGVLSMGQFLCYAAMAEGKEVSWVPSYGPEMRGGTANCMVVVANEAVDCPVFGSPDAGIMMNGPALDKFEKTIRPGGILIYNSSIIDRSVSRTDISVYPVPANDIATSLGRGQVANMVALGALLKLTPIVKVESILNVLKKNFPESKQHLLTLNLRAMEAGAESVSRDYVCERMAG